MLFYTGFLEKKRKTSHIKRIVVLFVLYLCRSDSTNSNSDNSDDEIPPHCHITIRCTREIAGFNGLGEAVRRLDFRSSVRDRRRFQYVCSLLRLLVSHKGIANLPGSAQRLLLQMLEDVAEHGTYQGILSNISIGNLNTIFSHSERQSTKYQCTQRTSIAAAKNC